MGTLRIPKKPYESMDTIMFFHYSRTPEIMDISCKQKQYEDIKQPLFGLTSIHHYIAMNISAWYHFRQLTGLGGGSSQPASQNECLGQKAASEESPVKKTS